MQELDRDTEAAAHDGIRRGVVVDGRVQDARDAPVCASERGILSRSSCLCLLLLAEYLQTHDHYLQVLTTQQ